MSRIPAATPQLHRPAPRVALLPGYLPRECGIAIYARDLRAALTGHHGVRVSVIALAGGAARCCWSGWTRSGSRWCSPFAPSCRARAGLAELTVKLCRRSAAVVPARVAARDLTGPS